MRPSLYPLDDFHDNSNEYHLCLLRAGKSTALSILGGLTKATDGTVSFSGNTTRPPRGTLGLVPQKNVLFPELSCVQTLRLWNAIKQEDGQYSDSEIERLIRDCDLQSKAHDPAGILSGGQKRKLQLAIGLVGGSKSNVFVLPYI